MTPLMSPVAELTSQQIVAIVAQRPEHHAHRRRRAFRSRLEPRELARHALTLDADRAREREDGRAARIEELERRREPAVGRGAEHGDAAPIRQHLGGDAVEMLDFDTLAGALPLQADDGRGLPAGRHRARRGGKREGSDTGRPSVHSSWNCSIVSIARSRRARPQRTVSSPPAIPASTVEQPDMPQGLSMELRDPPGGDGQFPGDDPELPVIEIVTANHEPLARRQLLDGLAQLGELRRGVRIRMRRVVHEVVPLVEK